MLGALALGAGISATGALIGSGINAYFQNRENKIMREREDNAISRRVRDLEASGLSPTLAAGSPASATTGTAPNVGDGVSRGADFMAKYLSLVQQKSDIAHTNSQISLNQLMEDSERYKQAFMQAQTEGENLRNNWINADMFSQLDLRDKQGQKIGHEMKQIIENTALLKAKTAYEQANKNFLMTQNENAKIQGQLLNFENDMKADTWAYQNLFPNTKSAFGAFGSAIAKNIMGGLYGTEKKLNKYGFKFKL